MSIATPFQELGRSCRRFGIILAISLLGCSAASAAVATRQNNTDTLDLGTAWSTGTPLTGVDVALWDSTIDGTVVGANTTSVGAGVTVGGLQITNPAVAITIDVGTGNLTLGNTTIVPAIDMSAATVDLTILANVALVGNQTWAIADGRTLSVGGVISGTGVGFTKTGTGTLNLSGSNTFTGPVTISAGAVLATSNTAFGTTASGVTVASGASLRLQGDLGVGAEALNLSGTGVSGDGALRSLNGNTSVGGPITLAADTLIVANADSLTLSGAINGNATGRALTFGGNGNFTISGAIGANVTSVVKNGTGQLILNAASTRGGNTTLNAGVLVLGNTTALQNSTAELLGGSVDFGFLSTVTFGGLAGSVSLALDNMNPSAVALTVGGNGASTVYTGVLSGNGSVTKIGNGSLTLSGANTYAGNTTVSGGGLGLDFSAVGAPASDILPSTTTLTLGGSTLNVIGGTGASNSQTVAGFVLNAGVSTIAVTQNGATSVDINLGNITRSVGSTLNFVLPTVGNVSTTAGVTNGVLTASDVAFATVGGTDWASVSGGNVVALGSYQTSTDPAVWTPTDNVSLATNPDATLGNMTINTLRLTGSSAIAVGATESLTLGAGGLLVTGAGSNSIAGGTLLGSGGANKELVIFQNNTAGPLVIASVIADNGGNTVLTKTGNGGLTLANANTYSGGSFISGGALNLGNAAALGTGAFTFAGTSLDNTSGAAMTLAGTVAKTLASDFTFVGTNDLNLGLGAVALTGNRVINVAAGNLAIGGAIGGAGFSLTKNGNGVLTLNAANTFGAGMTINTGTLVAGINGALANTNPLTVAAGATYNLGTFTQTVADLIGSGTVLLGSGSTLTVNYSANSVLAATLSGAGGFARSGTGNLTLGLTTTLGGALTLNGGNLIIPAALGLAVGSGSMPGNATTSRLLVDGGNFTSGGTFTINAAPTAGQQGLTLSSGSATFNNLVLNNTQGNNGHRPFANITGGEFIAGNVTVQRTTGAGDDTNVGGLNVSGGNATITGNFIVATASWSSSRVTGGNLTVGDTMVINQSTTPARRGSFQVTAGNLTVNNNLIVANIVGSTATALLNITGGNVVLNQLTMAPNSSITSGSATVTLSNALLAIGPGGIVNNGSGSFTPAINVNAGGIVGATANWTGNSPLTLNGGTIRAGDSSGTAFDITLSAALNGAGALVKSGNGILTLNATNTYTGPTNITAGTVQIGNGGTAGALGSNLTVNNNGTLAFNRSNTFTFAGVVGGTGSVRQTGSGTTQVTSVNAYTGATEVLNGTLALSGAADINSSSGITINGTSAVFQHGSSVPLNRTVTFGSNGGLFRNNAVYDGSLTLAGGAALGGTGSINGTVTVQAGGIVAPGTSIGTLTVASLTASSGAIFNYEFNTSPANDLLIVSSDGGLNLVGGGFNLYQEGTTNPWLSQGTYNLMQFNGTPAVNLGALSVLNPDITLGYTFQLSGNFLQLVIGSSALPNTWVATTGGSWGTPSNWSTGVPPANATAIFAGSISAPSDVTLDGNRAIAGISISSAQSYTIAQGSGGNLTIDGGVNPATLSISGSHAISAPTVFGANGVIVDVALGGTLTWSGNVLSNTGSLTKTGNGDLVLSGANAYSGGTLFNQGSVTFSASNNLGTGGLTFNGGGLKWATGSSADISDHTVTFAAGGAVFDTNGNDVTLSGSIGNDGTGALTKVGAGVLSLSGINSYSGGTNFNQGAIEFNSLDSFGAGALSFNGGVLRWAAGTSTDISLASMVFNAGGAAFDTNGNAVTLSAPIGGNGTGNFTKSGNGVLTLVATPTYTGQTFINSGTLAWGVSNLLPSTAVVTIEAGATLGLGAFSQTFGSINGTGTIDVAAGGVLAFSGAPLSTTAGVSISGAGALTKGGSGSVTLTGNSVITGVLTVGAGNLVLGSGGNLTTAGGLLTQNGGGRFIINGGEYTATGTFTVNSGNSTGGPGNNTLVVQAGNATFGNLTITNTSGNNGERPWMVVSGGNVVAGNITIPRITGSGNSSTGGLIVNGGNVNVTGTFLQAQQSWSALIVNGGNFTANTFIASQFAGSGRGGFVTVSSGTFTVPSAANGGFVVANANTNAVNVTFSGGLSSLEQLTFSAANVTGGAGNVGVTGGSLYIGSGGIVNLGSGFTANLTVNGGSIGALADWSSAANVPLTLGANNATFQTADSGGVAHNITISGNIGGAGALNKTGDGILTIAGNNSYSGGTIINTGTVQVGNGGAEGSLGSGNVTNNGQLAFNRSGSVTVNGVISGSGILTQNGPGSVTLTGENTYTGGTFITSGTLNVSNLSGSGVGPGDVSVLGGNLGGDGTVGGNVAVSAGGGVAPGTNQVGTLTVGSLNLDANTSLTYEFNDLANDKVIVTTPGGLTINSNALYVYKEGTLSGLTKQGTYELINYSGTRGGNLGLLSVANPVYGISYSITSNASAVLLTVGLQNLPFTWTNPVGGEWSTLSNWSNNTRPTAAGQLANFLAINDSSTFILVDINATLGGMVFASEVEYQLFDVGGTLTLNNNASAANLSVLAGNHTLAVPLLLTANGATANITAGSQLNITGNIGQTTAGALTKAGNGVLLLSGTNAYSGGTTLLAGTLFVNGPDALGTGALTINGGALGNSAGFEVVLNSNPVQSWNGDFSYVGPDALNLGTGAVTLSDNRTVTVTAGTLSVGGVISGPGFSLFKAGNGVLALNNVNTYDGGTAVLGGTLVLGVDNALAGTAPVFLQGGNLELGTHALEVSTLHLLNGNVSGTGTITAANDFDIQAGSVTAALAGNIGLNKTTTGSATLAGANVYTGPTNVANGVLVLAGGDDRLPTTTSFTIGSTGGTATLILGDAVSPSNQTLTNLATNGGTISIRGGNAISSTLTLNLATDTSFTGILGNAAGNGNNLILLKQGPGMLTLNGNNTYAGGTFINGGTIRVGAASALGTAGTSITSIGDATLEITTTFTNATNRFFEFTHANSTVQIDSGAVVPFGMGNLSGSGNLNKTGPGTLLLNNPSGNTGAFTGSVVIKDGILGGTGAFANATVTIAGGQFSPGAAGTSIGNFTAVSLIWNGGSAADALWTLSNSDNTSDHLLLTGALTKGTGSVFLFDFQGTGFFNGVDPTVYTLVDFASNSGFVASDFSYQNLAPGLAGNFVLNGTNLQVVVSAVPEPATWALLAGVATLGVTYYRRRRRQ